jgi:peptidoglycan-associated lipoprotein
MLKNLTVSMMIATASAVGMLACTETPKNVQEAVTTDKDKHQFTVDEKGKIEFKAEIVYFEYDSFTLTKEGSERLAVLAEHMKKNKDLKLEVAGHCDERGATEYNLALGEKRGKSVKNFLMTLGVEDPRIVIVSFGEEKPAAQGHDEKAWAQNRRTEFAFAKMDVQADAKPEVKAEAKKADAKPEVKAEAKKEEAKK